MHYLTTAIMNYNIIILPYHIMLSRMIRFDHSPAIVIAYSEQHSPLTHPTYSPLYSKLRSTPITYAMPQSDSEPVTT